MSLPSEYIAKLPMFEKFRQNINEMAMPKKFTGGNPIKKMSDLKVGDIWQYEHDRTLIDIEITGVSKKRIDGKLVDEPHYAVYNGDTTATNSGYWYMETDPEKITGDGEPYPMLEIDEEIEVDKRKCKIIKQSNQHGRRNSFMFYAESIDGKRLFEINQNFDLLNYLRNKPFDWNDIDNAYWIDTLKKDGLTEWADKFEKKDAADKAAKKAQRNNYINVVAKAGALPINQLYIVYAHSGNSNGWIVIGAENVANAKALARKSDWLDLGTVDSATTFKKYCEEHDEDPIESHIDLINDGNAPKKFGDYYEIEWGS